MMIYPHANISTHQHANTPTYQHWYVGTYRQERNRFYTVKNRKSKIGNNGKGTRNAVGLPALQEVLPLQERGNHSRLQRQSEQGASRRLKGQAAAPFPDKSSSRFAASVFIGKTLYPTAPCKRAFENGNDRPAAHHRPKGKNNKVGVTGKQAAGTATAERQTDRRTARRRVFTGKIP